MFRIFYGDICKMKTEAIVNSLGIDARYFGQVCKNIVSQADSDEVFELVNTKTNNNVFDIFVTDAGILKSKYIIHIVSPFKHLDDKNNTNLKKAYKLVIEEAIKRGYKSISIPFLGTGANGYSDSDVYDAATTVAKEYISDDDYDNDDLIDINLIIFNQNNKKYKHDELRGRYYADGLVSTSSYKIENDILSLRNCDDKLNSNSQSNLILDTMNLNKIFNEVNETEMFVPNAYITCVVDFIDSYIEQNNLSKKDLHVNGVDKDKMSKARLGKRTFKKVEIYRTGIILGWNRTVFLQAMSIAGYSFSPMEDDDVWFVNYLQKNKLIKGFNKFIDKFPDRENILFDPVK